jgi:hypothetical protein
VVQCDADIWRERDERETDKFLKCDMIKIDNATQEQVVLTYLERLCVPVLDLLNGRHATQAMRKFIQFFGSMRQSHGKFLCSSIKRSCNARAIMSYFKLTEQELTSS